MTEHVVATLSALLGFNVDEKGLNKFKLGIATANAALIKFTSDTLKTTQALTNLNIRTGISENIAYEWGRLADVTGIGKEAILSAFESISEAQADFKRGEGNISPYTFLGINPMGKKPEEVFQEVLQALDRFGDDAQAKTRALQDLGLDPLLQNLNLNNGLDKNLLLNKGDIKALQKLNSEFLKLKVNLAILRDKFIALATPLQTFLELQNRIINGLSLLIKNTIGFERASKILSATILTFLNTLFPKASVLGLILLAVEDLIVFLNGGTSVIGYFIEKIKEVIKCFGNLSTTAKVAITAITLLSGAFATFYTYKAVVGIFMNFKTIFSSLVGIFKVLKSLNPFTIIVLEIVAIVKGIKEFLEWIDKMQNKATDKAIKEMNSDEAIKRNWEKIENRMKERGASEEEIEKYKQNFALVHQQQRAKFEPKLAQTVQNNNGGNKTITQNMNNTINVNSVQEGLEAKRGLETQELDNIVMELNI